LANAERHVAATRRSHPARDWIADPYRDRALWYFFACLIVTIVLLVVADSVERRTPRIESAPTACSPGELIGGSLSLLVGGTATDVSGRRVRFLEISVWAEPQDHAITIIVPFASDPGPVLPRIEAIVSWFETLDER
jgi:hypothetical protein